MRVGVTGHRDLADPDAVAAEVDAALDRVLAGRSVGDVTPTATCVSSLAEGADRLVAQRVLARDGGRLEVVLPLPAADYADDFADDASRREFNDLLGAADLFLVVTADEHDASREAAYERAGHAVLAASDVVLALCDGEPSRGRGGTAEVVAEAERLGIPVEVIHVTRARP